MPRRDEDKYTCVLIANSNEPDLFNADNRSKFSTLDSLRTFELTTHNHEHVFDPSNDKFILMSGWTTITTDPETHHLSFELIRNVCKVNIKLAAFPEDALVYKYFQWRDVPLGKAFPHGHIKYTQSVSRDWKQHLDDDPNNDLKYDDLREGIDFYIPCNVWLPDGPKMPGNNLTKDERYEDPTHFVVVARELLGIDEEDNLIESGEQYEFCLYPSMKKDEQFDFQPNHYYKMEMSINGLPDYETNEFVNLIEYTYLQESNSYMMKRDSKEFFAVPITRVNRYWETFSEDGSELIKDDTEWVAEIIWQDSPVPILEFTSFRRYQAAKDKSRMEGKGEIYTTRTGETVENTVPLGDGEELPMCFAFRTTGSGEGNVVVGLRKKVPGWKDIPLEEREYLWSWHFWITDYDPSWIIPPNPDAGEVDYGGGNGDVNYQWQYHDVPGGQVQKYPTSGEMAGSSIYMMDRNLGATRTFTNRLELDGIFSNILNGDWQYRIQDVIQTFGVYYQYGRKEPFPHYDSELQPVYNYFGELIPALNKFPNMIISEQNEACRSNYPSNVAIKYPYKFYTVDKEHPFWYDMDLTSDETDNHEWNDPGIGTFSGKKFFDPCPPGWKMPEDMYDTFTSIGQSDDTNWFDYLYDAKNSAESRAVNFFAALMRYTEDGDFYNDHFIYFPSTGKRDHLTGGGPKGNPWALNAFNGTWTETKVMLVHNAPQPNFESSLPAASGVPIRCMREYPN